MVRQTCCVWQVITIEALLAPECVEQMCGTFLSVVEIQHIRYYARHIDADACVIITCTHTVEGFKDAWHSTSHVGSKILQSALRSIRLQRGRKESLVT